MCLYGVGGTGMGKHWAVMKMYPNSWHSGQNRTRALKFFSVVKL